MGDVFENRSNLAHVRLSLFRVPSRSLPLFFDQQGGLNATISHMRSTDPSLIDDYDHYPRIEAEFQAFLDQSLSPRGPELLYDIVGKLGLPPKADVLDLGCGEGRFSMELAGRFGFAVTGIDPVPRNIEVFRQRLDEAAKGEPGFRDLVRFEHGAGEAVPLPDASVGLIWCREVLVLVDRLDSVFAECRRVLRPAGRMLIYQNCGTDRLEPREARLLGVLGKIRSMADRRRYWRRWL